MKTTRQVFPLILLTLLTATLPAQTLDDQIARLRTLCDQGLGERHPTVRSLVHQIDELRHHPRALTSHPDYMALRAERISIENALTLLTMPPAPGLPIPARQLKADTTEPSSFTQRLATIDTQLAELETQLGHHWNDLPARNPK